MTFCDFSADQYNTLVQAFQQTFSFSEDLLDKPYSFFRTCFENPEAHLGYITPNLLRNQIQPKTEDADFLNKYNDTSYCLGIDLPILLTKDSNSNSILVIAEDPLRNPEDPLIKVSADHALLSTPFATHLDSCRKALKEYWNFHEALLNDGFNVYILNNSFFPRFICLNFV